jgi:hypothetical protein
MNINKSADQLAAIALWKPSYLLFLFVRTLLQADALYVPLLRKFCALSKKHAPQHISPFKTPKAPPERINIFYIAY